MNKPLQLLTIAVLLGMLFLLVKTPALDVVIEAVFGPYLTVMGERTPPDGITVEADTARVMVLICLAPNGNLLGRRTIKREERQWLRDHHFELKEAKDSGVNDILGRVRCSGDERTGMLKSVYFIYVR